MSRVSEKHLLAVKRSLEHSAKKAIPGDSEEDKKRRRAYVYGTLRKIQEGEA